MAAPSFRSGTHQRTTVSASLTATEPAGAAENDILIYYLDYYEQDTDFVSGPSGGWTLLNTWTGTAVSGRLYWIRRGASAPGLTTTTNSNSWIEVIVVAVSGAVASGSPIDAEAYTTIGTANPPNPNPPSITTTVADTLVLAVGMGWTGWTSGCTAPSGYTLCTTPQTTDDAAIAYKTLTAAGAEDPASFSGQGTTSNEWHAATIAIKGPSAGEAKLGAAPYAKTFQPIMTGFAS